MELMARVQKILGKKIFQDAIICKYGQEVYATPVAGEPSWGTPHKHIETLVNAVDPAGSGDTTVTVTNAPTGANGIFGWASIGSALTGNRYLDIKDVAGNVWARIYMNNSTAIPGTETFFVPLDANKQFLYAASNADVNAVSIYMRLYFT